MYFTLEQSSTVLSCNLVQYSTFSMCFPKPVSSDDTVQYYTVQYFTCLQWCYQGWKPIRLGLHLDTGQAAVV